MTTFEEARSIIADALGIEVDGDPYVVGDYGFEDADHFAIPAGHRVGVYGATTPEEANAVLRLDDAPMPVVDKATGAFSFVQCPANGDLPYPGMTQIGVLPEDR